MSRIPKIGFGSSISKDSKQKTNTLGVAAKKTSGSDLTSGFKRPSEDRLNTFGKRQKTDLGSVAKNKVSSTIQLSDADSKFGAPARRAILQPVPDNGLVRASMPAVVSTTKMKIPGKPKRPAWDLKGRIQDMEENFTATQQHNAMLKDELEAYNQRIANLESANNMLHRDVEIKSVQSEEATAQMHKLEKELKQKIEECESITKEKERIIEKFEREIKSLNNELTNAKNEYQNLQSLYQQETSTLKSSITSLTCMQSGIQAELDATKLLLRNKEMEIQQLKNMCSDKDSRIECLSQQVSTIETKLRDEESLRRKLHNTVQELKGNIRVFCRLRPPLPEEIKNGMTPANVVAVSDKTIEINHLGDIALNESGTKMQPKYEFSFDCFFDQSTSQGQIFDEISQLVQSALDGYNVCIFAYGQTGSGKTFTMEGPSDIVDFVANKNHPNLGMIPRSVQQIFSTIALLEPKGWKYKVEALFLEIYNERIRDLLNSQGSNTKCEILKSGSKGTDCVISNVTTSEVSSSEEVYELMKKARMNRVVAATKCNEYSSRSHYVFQMKIYGENSITGEKCDGTLNLVDLAGSERVKESESAGDRLVEAKSINKSLSNLGKVILSLSKKENHVPYRDSKLTHLLANSLGGSSKTLMFVNISPDNKNLFETINSLRFATKVNQCNIGTAQRRIK